MHQQSGLNVAKQLQTQDFIQRNDIDILHCQEINIDEDSFKTCDILNANYDIHANNALNKYGTASIVRSNLKVDNIRTDTEGRGMAFDIGNITLANFYLHSGTDAISRGKEKHIVVKSFLNYYLIVGPLEKWEETLIVLPNLKTVQNIQKLRCLLA